MKQLIQNLKSGELQLAEVPPPISRPGHIGVHTHYSLVSAGTERSLVDFGKHSLLEKAWSRPDLVREVLQKARADGVVSAFSAAMHRLEEPFPLGYSSSGAVLSVGQGTEEFAKGGLVACAGGQACHAEVVCVPKNLAATLPKNVSPQEAAFTTLGAIALQGVRRAGLSPGERVAVIGLGLLGLLTVQLLNAYGFPAIGLDVSRRQVEKAYRLGLSVGAVIGEDTVINVCSAFSEGRGVDAVIITASTKSSDPVRLAGEICRDRGRVSVVGDVGMEVPRRVYYGKELDLRVSRSYGPGRYDPVYEEKGVDYPYGYVRWTEKRNMEEFLRLISTGRVDVKSMVSHVFSFEEAVKAYELILDNPNKEDFTAVLLEYDHAKEHSQTIWLTPSREKRSPERAVSVGLIGGGAFARGTILPTLSKLPEVQIRAVATASGKSAGEIAKKHGCAYATTDYQQILDDEAVNLVIIATRHNLHAPLSIEALGKGKNVYVEKPLALNVSELRRVVQAWQQSQGRLMVGFNRRFAPQSMHAKDTCANRVSPLMAHYRVNAGFIPRDHWVHDPVEGGGRILGEVCHFVDFLQFLTGAAPVGVYAMKLPQKGRVVADDNVSVLIDFADGSKGSILYTAMGDRALAKEYIEIFCDGKALTIDNFRSGGPLAFSQDKGFRGEFKAIAEAIMQGRPSPIPVQELALTTLATLKIVESLDEGQPMAIKLSEVLADE